MVFDQFYGYGVGQNSLSAYCEQLSGFELYSLQEVPVSLYNPSRGSVCGSTVRQSQEFAGQI
jgi:hypothetical protein